MLRELSGKPLELTISRWWGLQRREVTWEPVSMLLTRAPEVEFQKWMWRS
jgi:hypothetical protein